MRRRRHVARHRQWKRFIALKWARPFRHQLWESCYHHHQMAGKIGNIGCLVLSPRVAALGGSPLNAESLMMSPELEVYSVVSASFYFLSLPHRPLRAINVSRAAAAACDKLTTRVQAERHPLFSKKVPSTTSPARSKGEEPSARRRRLMCRRRRRRNSNCWRRRLGRVLTRSYEVKLGKFTSWANRTLEQGRSAVGA